MLYSPQQSTPALSSYFELMDRLIPSFLSTLSTPEDQGLPHPAEVGSDEAPWARGTLYRPAAVQLHLPLCLAADRAASWHVQQRRYVVYAIINSGGHQVKVAPGATVDVDRVEARPGDEVSFTDVLLVEKDGGEIVTGTPFVSGAKVVAVVEGESRGPEDSRVQEEAPQGHAPDEGPPQHLHAGAHHRDSSC